MQAEQDLKKVALNVISKPLRVCYNEIVSKLLLDGFTPDIIAAKFPSYQKISSTLQKRRRKKQPAVPKIFSSLEICDEYTKTTTGERILTL